MATEEVFRNIRFTGLIDHIQGVCFYSTDGKVTLRIVDGTAFGLLNEGTDGSIIDDCHFVAAIVYSSDAGDCNQAGNLLRADPNACDSLRKVFLGIGGADADSGTVIQWYIVYIDCMPVQLLNPVAFLPLEEKFNRSKLPVWYLCFGIRMVMVYQVSPFTLSILIPSG